MTRTPPHDANTRRKARPHTRLAGSKLRLAGLRSTGLTAAGLTAAGLVAAGLAAAGIWLWLSPLDPSLATSLTNATAAGVLAAQEAGPMGGLLFGLVYAALVTLAVPGSLITLAAGYLYGPLGGLLIVSPASVLGATGAFLLARFVERNAVRRRLARGGRLAALERAVREEGTRAVVLLRLSPVLPFTLLNFGLGLTGVKLRDYVLGSWVGMLPGTFLYVYIGSLLPDLTALLAGELPDGGPMATAMRVAGLVATLVVTVQVTRIARRASQDDEG